MQVTFYTSVGWLHYHIIHVVINDTRQHNKTIIAVFTAKLLELKPQDVKYVKNSTDGPNSPSKNKFVMGTMSMLSHDVEIEWKFSVTSHGKGLVDSVGAIVKKVASVRVQNCHTGYGKFCKTLYAWY